MHPHFEVHKLNAAGMEKAKAIATAFDDFATSIKQIAGFPLGRQESIVMTNLEEACFHAKKGMAMQTDNQEA